MLTVRQFTTAETASLTAQVTELDVHPFISPELTALASSRPSHQLSSLHSVLLASVLDNSKRTFILKAPYTCTTEVRECVQQYGRAIDRHLPV